MNSQFSWTPNIPPPSLQVVVCLDKRKDGRIEQVIEQRHVAAHSTRIATLDMVFELKGSYAPRKMEIDHDPVSVTVIDVSAIPKHG